MPRSPRELAATVEDGALTKRQFERIGGGKRMKPQILGVVGLLLLAGCVNPIGSLGAATKDPVVVNATVDSNEVFDRIEPLDIKGEPAALCVDEKDTGVMTEWNRTFYASRIYLTRGATTDHGVRTLRFVAPNGRAYMDVNISAGEFSLEPVCVGPGTVQVVALNRSGDVVSQTTINASYNDSSEENHG